jgi:DNA-binding CsgD family transcriptional regulator
MCPTSLCDLKRLTPATTTVQPAVDQLIRILVSMAPGREDLSPPADMEVEEVLVDIELDGLRYLLIRLPKPTAVSTRVSLSPREREIVRMVAQGHPNKVIAGVLNISGWTVCTHLRRIFAKLNVGSRAAMVARLLEMGSVEERIRASAEGRGAASTEAASHLRQPLPNPNKVQVRVARR